MRFKTQKSGEWVQPRMKNYYMKCCDCGLTHRLNFKLIPYGNHRHKIQFQAFRVERRKRECEK